MKTLMKLILFQSSLLSASRKRLPSDFPTRSETKRDLQPQKMIRGFGFRQMRGRAIYASETKALISCAIDLRFVFAYTESRISHNASCLFSDLLS